MKELHPLFFKALEFGVNARLVPAQSAADLRSGIAAALFLPAGAQRHGNAAEKDIAQRNGTLMGHRLHGFGYQMAAMGTERFTQALIE